MLTDYIVTHQSEFWLILGFLLLSIEVVTGLGTGIFLFGGLGALVTGVLMTLGVLPETWIAGISCTGISSGIVTVLLWKPMKKLQDNGPLKKDNSSDIVGYEFVLDTDITFSQPGVINYSGITWKVEIDKDAGVDSIGAGERVVVSSVEVGVFRVRVCG